MRKTGVKGHLGVILERFTFELALKHLTARQPFVMHHLLHYPATRFDLIACSQQALSLPADAALLHADQIAFEGFVPDQG